MKYFYASLFLLCIWTIGYTVPRTDIGPFLILFTLTFGLYLLIFKQVKDHHDFLFFIGTGLVARFGLLLAWPGLSDDLYRFFWDGVIANQGISPYAWTPAELMAQGNIVPEYLAQSIYPNLNSTEYYSVYPPLAQLFYRWATFFTPDNIQMSVIFMRILILAAESGIIYLLLKLLPALKYQQKNALLYALNPLVILEFTANLHAEVIMLGFFLYAFWWLLKGRWILFSVLFAAGILMKLTIVLLIPLFIRRLGLRRFLWSTAIIIILCGLGYGAMGILDHPRNYLDSMRLFVQTFEFNASFYYFFRWIGYQLVGYNLIYWIGPTLMVAAGMGYMLMYVLQYLNDKGLLIRALFIFTILLLSSTTVHPWYILLPLTFGLFSPYRYPIVWSLLIVFSYMSYTSEPYREWIWIVFLEYLILGVVMLIDFKIIPWKSYFTFFENEH